MAFDVKAFRKRLGLTQIELAKKLHVNERQVRRWERYGVKARPHQVARMKQLETARTMGQMEQLPKAVPLLPSSQRRAIPLSSVRTGNPAAIGITPSSF